MNILESGHIVKRFTFNQLSEICLSEISCQFIKCLLYTFKQLFHIKYQLFISCFHMIFLYQFQIINRVVSVKSNFKWLYLMLNRYCFSKWIGYINHSPEEITHIYTRAQTQQNKTLNKNLNKYLRHISRKFVLLSIFLRECDVVFLLRHFWQQCRRMTSVIRADVILSPLTFILGLIFSQFQKNGTFEICISLLL